MPDLPPASPSDSPPCPPVSPAPPATPRPPRTFGLLEVLVAMCIVITLAGMLVPYSVKVGERTALTKATEDLATIAASFSSSAQLHARWLHGAGALPAGCPPELDPLAPAIDRLSLPSRLDRQQRAALLLALQPDPWGDAYLIFLDEPGHDRAASLALSAGPDRTLGTIDDLQQPIR